MDKALKISGLSDLEFEVIFRNEAKEEMSVPAYPFRIYYYTNPIRKKAAFRDGSGTLHGCSIVNGRLHVFLDAPRFDAGMLRFRFEMDTNADGFGDTVRTSSREGTLPIQVANPPHGGECLRVVHTITVTDADLSREFLEAEEGVWIVTEDEHRLKIFEDYGIGDSGKKISALEEIFSPLAGFYIPGSKEENGVQVNRKFNLGFLDDVATRDFVERNIAKADARFKGTFNSLAELEAVANADNNDYGFVVSVDADGNTLYKRYKFDGEAWAFEFTLSNIAFSADQWAAIQSGITRALVEKLVALPSSPITPGTGENAAIQKGSTNAASGDYSLAVGKDTTASGRKAYSEGGGTTASGEMSHAEGEVSEASARGAHSEGKSTKAKGMYAHAEGSESEAGFADTTQGQVWGDQTAHAEGYKTKAIDRYSHAEGYKTVAGYLANERPDIEDQSNPLHNTPDYDAARAAHAEGYQSKASGIAAHAEGSNTHASGEAAHSEGIDTQAEGPHAHAEGHLTNARMTDSHAEGYNTETGGNAETYKTNADAGKLTGGAYAHAEGNATIAKGQSSHAEGLRTYAGAQASHAEGARTRAVSTVSHAEGADTEACGDRSHSEGEWTISQNKAEHAQGRYNKSNKVAGSSFGNAGNTIHSVGVGTSENTRKNAWEIMQNGDAYLLGVGGYDGTNPAAASTVKEVMDLKAPIDMISTAEFNAIFD